MKVDTRPNTQYTEHTTTLRSTMDHDLMYVVINGEAIMLENGAPVSYLVDDNDGTIDWTAGDTLDWDDMLPEEYKMYKTAVDFLQTYATSVYIK